MVLADLVELVMEQLKSNDPNRMAQFELCGMTDVIVHVRDQCGRLLYRVFPPVDYDRLLQGRPSHDPSRTPLNTYCAQFAAHVALGMVQSYDNCDSIRVKLSFMHVDPLIAIEDDSQDLVIAVFRKHNYVDKMLVMKDATEHAPTLGTLLKASGECWEGVGGKAC